MPHDPAWQQSRWRSSVRRRLLAWYDAHARALPWRQTSDPYRIWISEVMLQQTQVATVIAYYQRFTERFPDPVALAQADEAQVLRLWEGLGYYRRARQLHAAAQIIAERYGGRFPERFEDVLALPGVGRYTAGAVLSIARDQRLPVVEANTQRLFSRLVAMQRPPAAKTAQDLLWRFAATMLPREGSGRLNQAAMELGSLICTPRDPACDRCPLVRNCAAHRLGIEREIPGKVKQIQYEERTEFALLVRRGAERRYFVHRIPAGSRWAGLWDFPRYGAPLATSVGQAAAQAARQFRLQIQLGQPLVTIRHAVTRYRITLHAHHAHHQGAVPPADDQHQRWVTADQLLQLPLNVTGRKMAQHLAEPG